MVLVMIWIPVATNTYLTPAMILVLVGVMMKISFLMLRGHESAVWLL